MLFNKDVIIIIIIIIIVIILHRNLAAELCVVDGEFPISDA